MVLLRKRKSGIFSLRRKKKELNFGLNMTVVREYKQARKKIKIEQI